ncbi:MAG: SIS domain-containing protein [Actinomycetota bacterium]|nr:SIS domain-containing protein [Actinomycetota bacterium]
MGDLGRLIDAFYGSGGRERLEEAARTFLGGGTVWTFGNGGSATDASHLTGELLGKFRRPDRRSIPSMALVDPAVLTAIGNDYGFRHVFVRPLEALSRPGDVAVGFTTSGESENVLLALASAASRGVRTVAFCGRKRVDADVLLSVDSTDAAEVQNLHRILIHEVCDLVDRWA